MSNRLCRNRSDIVPRNPFLGVDSSPWMGKVRIGGPFVMFVVVCWSHFAVRREGSADPCTCPPKRTPFAGLAKWHLASQRDPLLSAFTYYGGRRSVFVSSTPSCHSSKLMNGPVELLARLLAGGILNSEDRDILSRLPLARNSALRIGFCRHHDMHPLPPQLEVGPTVR